MSVRTDPSVTTVDRWWAGTPLDDEHWLERADGFPPGSVGAGIGDTPGAEAVAKVRGAVLTHRQLTEVVAFAEFLTGVAVSAAERDELTENLVDAFEDNPSMATRVLRPLTGGVARIASMDPLRRCARRLQALTAVYTVECRRQADGADPSPIVDVVSRHNPLVRRWETSGVILVADAVTARVEQHRLLAAIVGTAPEPPEALRDRLLAQAETAGRMANAELAGAELRLLTVRAWLRHLGDAAATRLRDELARAYASALDVDLVVQQVAFQASLEWASMA
jgi:hypothetical protein